MIASSVLVGVLLAAAAWHIAATIAIFDDLRRRGQGPSFLLLRLYAPVYARDYRRLSLAETGRTGPLFYHWVASINVALLGAILLGAIAAR